MKNFDEWYASESCDHDTAHGLALAAWEHQSDEIAALKIELADIEKAFRKRMPDDEWLNINYPEKGTD